MKADIFEKVFKNKTVFVTGHTGFIGSWLVQWLSDLGANVIGFSLEPPTNPSLFESIKLEKKLVHIIGNVNDQSKLEKSIQEHTPQFVFHLAAQPLVKTSYEQPLETIQTNVMGADNIVDAAIEKGVQKVINLSTDKAVNPINLYGATKLVAEKIFVAANSFAGGKVKFSGVRYGNVIGSRGSVIPIFLGLKAAGKKEFPITDPQMTRFWISLDQSVELVIRALLEAEGGEIFIPKIPSMTIKNLAKAIDPECTFSYTGIRPGEKLHESLISDDEARNAREFNDVYVICPQSFDTTIRLEKYNKYPAVPDGFVLRSDNPNMQLDREELRELVGSLEVG